MSEEQMLKTLQHRQLLDRMQAITNPSVIAGAIAPGNILTGNTSSPSVFGARRLEVNYDPIRCFRTTIVQADNGYILHITPDDMSVSGRVLVASTVEELRDLITAEMVGKKMEK